MHTTPVREFKQLLRDIEKGDKKPIYLLDHFDQIFQHCATILFIDYDGCR